MTTPILRFDGDYRFLSNFWPAPVRMNHLDYPSVEHAYQAGKHSLTSFREQIRRGSAAEAKKLGKLNTPPQWYETKALPLMEDLVFQKFRHWSLRKQLLATGDAEIVEGNHWGDRFWGKDGGEGQNHLGRILMDTREKVKFRSWQMFAHERDDGFAHVGSCRYVELHYMNQPVVSVRVTESPDGEYYGWTDSYEKAPCLIWRHFVCFNACFSNGYEAEEKRALGWHVRLSIEKL